MEIKITDFKRGGMTDQLRGSSGFALVSKFCTIRPERAEPTGDFAATTHSTYTITDNDIKMFTEYEGTVYGLGVVGSNAAVHNWNESTDQWNELANLGTSGVSGNFFIAYKGFFYGARAGSQFWRMEVDGSPVTASWQAVSYTNTAQAVYHPADDILYLFYDNKVASWDNSTFTAAALTLPTNFVITSGTAFGEYLLIGGYDSTTNKSTVYWWDRDSSLSTVTTKNILDIGRVQFVLKTNGVPVAVVVDNGSGLVVANTMDELRVYELSLSGVRLVNRFQEEIIAVGTLQGHEYDDRAYFGVKISDTVNTYRGIMVVDEFGNLSIERTVTDATADIQSVYRSGQRSWASTTDNNVYVEGTNYTDASVIETRKYRIEDGTKQTLEGITLISEPLPSGGQIVLKGRVDAETSWTTLGTFTTQNNVFHYVTDNLYGSEFQFRIESTGQATPNGFYAKTQEVEDKSYG